MISIMQSPFSVPPRYEVELGLDYPADGDWRVPSFFFDRDRDVSTTPKDSRWGALIVLRVTVHGAVWVGTFTAGADGMSGVFATPDPYRLCCVTKGFAYVVDVTDPAAGADVAREDTVGVTAVPAADRLLLSGFVDITALGRGGIVWRSGRLVLDDLTIVETSRERVVCTGSVIPGEQVAHVVLDASSGEVVEGQPPDRL